MARKPKLSIVKPIVTDTDVKRNVPPATLGKTGAALWASIMLEHNITDAGRRETLLQICLAVDRAAECADIIARDGTMIRGQNGLKEHPLLKVEMNCQSFVVRGLARLSEKKPVGRPSHGFGVLG
jgi:hypothetical protein